MDAWAAYCTTPKAGKVVAFRRSRKRVSPRGFAPFIRADFRLPGAARSVNLAESEAAVVLPANKLDADPWLFGVQNGNARNAQNRTKRGW
jgi:hypothetical protein